jgi:hypothetical protein
LPVHYNDGATVAPSRIYSPKDKALVEGAVKTVQKCFRWKNRKITFTSLGEINRVLREISEIISNKVHRRFSISRREMFKQKEISRKIFKKSCCWKKDLVWNTFSARSGNCRHYFFNY